MNRTFSFERISNFRDIGGYPAARGRTVKWRTIFRSGAIPSPSTADLAQLESFNIHTLFDLRSLEERQLAPMDWISARQRSIALDYPAATMFARARNPADAVGGSESQDLYELFPKLLKHHYKIMFENLLAGPGATLIHCSAGQDRTGIGVCLILTALGVPRDIIIEDYLLSPQHRRPEHEITLEAIERMASSNSVAKFYKRVYAQTGGQPPPPRALHDEAGNARLALALAVIEKTWGGVGAYLENAIGVDENAVAELQRRYLV